LTTVCFSHLEVAGRVGVATWNTYELLERCLPFNNLSGGDWEEGGRHRHRLVELACLLDCHIWNIVEYLSKYYRFPVA